MRKNIIGAIIVLMLAIPTITALGETRDNKITPIDNPEDDLLISLYKGPLFLGVIMDIENVGATTLNNVEWSFRTKAAITGSGVLINEKLQGGVIDEIQPGEKVTLQFRPFNQETKSPLGLGNLYMNASVAVNGMSVRTQQRAIILGIFLIMYRDTYMDIKPKEAYERYQNEEFDLIIDVVGLDIYSLGHLPGAVNYVWADGTLNDKIPDLDPTLTYLVYCHTDPPSTASAQALIDAGIEDVYRLEGNFKAWKDAGYPVET
jgi:rhodanese-related sulfurtransferase